MGIRPHIYQANGTVQALDANLKTEEWEDIPMKTPIVMGGVGVGTHTIHSCNLGAIPQVKH